MVYHILVSDLPRVSSSMDDIDRLLEEDYEPSDKDIVKARLRTVGIQEYHFSIPSRGIYPAFDASEAPCPNPSLADGRNEDWILYDVCGSRTSVSPNPTS